MELPESLIAMLARQVETGPDVETMVEVGGQRLAYRQLWDRAARVAGGLRAAGVARGDRVAVRYPAGVNWVLAFWGTLMAGGVAVAVNTRSSQPEVEFVLQDAGVTVDLAADSPLPDGDPLVVDGLGLSDVAAFFYTSGTTGNPKGVPTTHEAFLTNAENMLTCLGLVSVPAIYSLILRRPEFATTDVSAVRWVGYGGAPIAPALAQAVQDAFPAARVCNGYGMTETASIMSVLPHDDAIEHADSVGYSVPSVDLGIVPLDDDPSTGELVVRVDDAGRAHIVDRIKDIIIRGGENVSSIEVESALLAAPGVAEAAVVLKAQLRKSVEWGAPL
jgi:acyl-CoA synthetase (AMP-forming)/AMP-acid ligase II